MSIGMISPFAGYTPSAGGFMWNPTLPPSAPTQMAYRRSGNSYANGAPRQLYRRARVFKRNGVVSRRPRQELKACDIDQNQVLLFNKTGVFIVINTPVQGTAFNQRIGNTIRMSYLSINGHIQPTNTAGHSTLLPDIVRIMVIYDRQPNGALPVTSDVIQSVNNVNGTSSGALDGLNMVNNDRFIVLKDKFFYVNEVTAPGGPGVSALINDNLNGFNFRWRIPMRGLETRFNATDGGTVADINTGAVHIFAICNQPTSGNEVYQLQWAARLRFTD